MLLLLLCLLLTFSVVQPLAPPLYQTKESLVEYRRGRNITWDYMPRHLHPEHCRHMTEAQCQSLDQEMETYSSQTRNRHLQVDTAPNKGRFVVFVALCRFNNHLNRNLPPPEYFDKLFNGGETNTTSRLYKKGSISDWLYQQSVGNYKVKFVIAPEWITLPGTEQFYAAGVSGLQGPGVMQDIFKPVMDHWYKVMGAEAFYQFDSRGWGVLDQLVAIHSGHGAEIGKIEEMPERIPKCGEKDQQYRIWAQGTPWTGPGHWTSPDFAFEVRAYLISGAFDPELCEENWATLGIIAHEYMHGFGCVDLYDADPDEKETMYLGGTGRFDIMSAPFGWWRDLTIPGHAGVYSKWLAGWLSPIEIYGDGFFPIQAGEYSMQAYIIKKNFPKGEYLLIENRQPIKYDRDWPLGGIVIYHVDNDKYVKGQVRRGYPGHPNWPRDHYEVAIVQKDGAFEIEKGIPGNKGDFWKLNEKLGSSCETWPNTCSYRGGVLAPTGIEISVSSDLGFIMSFNVSGLGVANPGVQRSNRIGDLLNATADDNSQQAREQGSPGYALGWILSIVSGVAVMLGVLLLML